MHNISTSKSLIPNKSAGGNRVGTSDSWVIEQGTAKLGDMSDLIVVTPGNSVRLSLYLAGWADDNLAQLKLDLVSVIVPDSIKVSAPREGCVIKLSENPRPLADMLVTPVVINSARAALSNYNTMMVVSIPGYYRLKVVACDDHWVNALAVNAYKYGYTGLPDTVLLGGGH
ncbi:MAG: hypothetical protein [Caudoviricetes sp.]|nr:MAG: hypothetical protein [Caudoviricetes sp.]